MPDCYAKDCKSRATQSRKSKIQLEWEASHRKISFHRIPNEPAKRKKWLDIMGLDASSVPKTAALCSLHFDEKDIDRTSLNSTRLYPGAAPFECSREEEPPSKRRKVQDEHPVHQQTTADHMGAQNVAQQIIDIGRKETVGAIEYNNSSIENCTHPSGIADTPSTPKVSDKDFCTSPGPTLITQGTAVSPHISENTPRKKFLRTALRNTRIECQMKLKMIKQKLNRTMKRIAKFKDVLAALRQKNLLDAQQLDILKDMGNFKNQFLKRQILKANKKAVPKKYSPEIRSFALTSHYYSPRAYAYVRKKFDTCLPHPKTLCKWYKSVNGEPGFNEEATKTIENRARLVDYPLFGVLIFDEMAIRRHVEYDGEKCRGYVDMGPDIDCGYGTIAKESLVFLVNCINGSWKIPIGYFLINSVTAEQKANLVRQALIALHEHGMNVIAVTFDGAPANLTMCTMLGCNLNYQTFQSYFCHPTTNEKVFAFLDACHDLKLLRNLIEQYKILIDDNGDTIEWKYFAMLNDLQVTEGLHLGNKLRTLHIHYQNQKMKVKLAAQTFSASVADALELCKTDLQLPEFADSGPTIRFIRMVNDVFDILNSRNMNQFGFKQPLHETNSATILSKLNDCYNYLSQLRTCKGGELLIHTRKKTAIIGFMMCIKSLTMIYRDLVVAQDMLKYLPSYKFSQDHIELLFGCIRAHGGCNNNPTARQFRAAYKKILVHTEISETSTGNCIPLEAISILHVSANSETVINQSTPKSRLINDIDCEDDIDLPDLPNGATLSEFSTRVIAYIAGFVVRHLKKKLHCENCIQALTGNESHIECTLINIKNCGGLTYPSHNVIVICNKAESIIRLALRVNGMHYLLQKISATVLLNRVLESFVGNTNLFDNLDDHSHDQNALENHAVHLTRAVAAKYIKIRLYFMGRNVIDNNALSRRHMYNKLVLFKGQ